MPTISPEEIALVGTIIAIFLEVAKLVPELIKRQFGKDFTDEFTKSLPAIAIVMGVTINYLFISPTEVIAKDVLFIGAIFGLSAIGGREATISMSKNKPKKDP